MNRELLGFVTEELLNGSTLTVKAGDVQMEVCQKEKFEENDTVSYTFEGAEDLMGMTITARGTGDTIVLSLDASSDYKAGKAFSAKRTVNFTFGGPVPEKILGSYMDLMWWTYPEFPKNFSELVPTTQNMLLKYADKIVYVQPLCNGNFSTEIDGEGFHLEPRTENICTLTGDFAAITVGENPITIYRTAMENISALGGMTALLKRDRQYPEIMEWFGWCTWNAFYTNVTEDKIIEKLQEFKEKGIPVGWVIIDDGWFTAGDKVLRAFEADPVKFPNGLKHCIDRMKNEYGVKQVGVWHAFEGYWNGVEIGSALYEEWKDCLEITPEGFAIPAHDVDRAFAFWDAWHSYLAGEGIDFVKVDNQSSHPHHMENMIPGPVACRIAHEALERSVDKNFNGTIINCMGEDMENVLSRHHSAITRNSDDFFPNRERGFLKHLAQNVYSALWHSELYYCDFDMWWSGTAAPVQSGVLRAVSGSPVYISDEVGASDPAMIFPVIEDDGRIIRFEESARPTEDLIFTDCSKEDRLLKVFNVKDDAFVLAAFNVSTGDVTDTLCYKDITGLKADQKYVSYEYFSKKYTAVTAESIENITLPMDGTAVYSIYPVAFDAEGEYIMAGPESKYAGSGSVNKKKIYLKEIM